jgi:hypothetical protein
MPETKHQNSPNLPVNAADDSDDSGVPFSERGKGENMPMDKRHASWVFAIVGLTFFLLLIVVVVGLIAYLNIELPGP